MTELEKAVDEYTELMDKAFLATYNAAAYLASLDGSGVLAALVDSIIPTFKIQFITCISRGETAEQALARVRGTNNNGRAN